MAKAKPSKGTHSVPNKALHSRVSYLYQAAAYFATEQQHSGIVAGTTTSLTIQNDKLAIATADASTEDARPSFKPVSRRLISDLRSVSLKVQIRMSPAMKHSICKSCDTMLIDGSTCTANVENRSRGGKKPWADVLVRKCNACGLEKRFPLAVEKQKRQSQRQSQIQARTEDK